MNKKLKIAVIAVIVIVAIVVIVTIYRMYFKFNRKLVNQYAEMVANSTGAPNDAYKIIIELCENILKSQDLSAAVCVNAKNENIDKELALVQTALNQAYCLGFIAPPQPADNTENQ